MLGAGQGPRSDEHRPQPQITCEKGHFFRASSQSGTCVPQGGLCVHPHLMVGVKGSDHWCKWGGATCVLLGPDFLVERPVL